jgi:2-polyprenyl-3-methyl-5-hydroxy-6-metoxy-1,4-benzoquinol methylase
VGYRRRPARAGRLLDAHPPTGTVLDVGCGSGDHAIALAQRGLPVLGVDFVEAAIEQARAKAASLLPETRRLLKFEVADGLRPSLTATAWT